MNISQNVEALSFKSGINVIAPAHYPENFPLHCHKYIEIIAIPDTANNKHTTHIRINQQFYDLHSGDILFIWPGELHETIHTGGNLPMGVQFASYLIQDLPDFAPYINLFRAYQHIRKEDAPEASNAMMQHLLEMIPLKEAQQNFHETRSTICLLELFIDFAEYMKQHKNSFCTHPKLMKGTDKINDACSYIIAHSQQDLTLEEVANHVGFNSSYLSRVFKKATGYHFVEYLTLQRVNAAQLLLTDSTITITEVAFQAGFKSISSFNRVFKQYRGCSPREYRNYYLS